MHSAPFCTPTISRNSKIFCKKVVVGKLRCESKNYCWNMQAALMTHSDHAQCSIKFVNLDFNLLIQLKMTLSQNFFHFCSNLQKKVPNYRHEHRDLAPFLENWSQSLKKYFRVCFISKISYAVKSVDYNFF